MNKFKETDFDMSTEETDGKKRHIFYRKLVVPVRMRSVYWKYFGFPANDDGKILTKDKIVCLLCKAQMIYNRNTSNLRMHLLSKHKNSIQTMEPDIDLVLEAMKIKKHKKAKAKEIPAHRVVAENEFSVNEISRRDPDTREVQVVVSESDISNIAILLPNEEVDNSFDMKLDGITSRVEHADVDIVDAALSFIITDLISPDILEGKGFSELLTRVSGKKVTLPSENKIINENLPAIHNTCKEQLFNTITSNCITNIALSIEEWKSIDNITCLSVYMHYLQNGEPCLFTKLLTTTFCMGTESETHWESFLNRLFNEWSINVSAVSAVLVSFKNEKLNGVLKNHGLILLPCFVFLIQEICRVHCFGHADVSVLLDKCRKLTKFILESKLDIPEDDSSEVEEDENDSRMILLDNPDLWLSTYYMVRSLFLRKNTITEYLSQSESVSEDIIFTQSDWQNVFDVLNVLEPLKTIVTTLLQEKSSLISLLKPLILEVTSSKFETSITDSPVVSDLKNIIKSVLNEAYAEESIDNLIHMSTTLDPRFKEHFQLDGLTTLLTQVVKSEGSSSPSSLPTIEKTIPEKKNGRSSINAIFGNFKVHKPALSLEDKVKTEVCHFESESGPQLENCPLIWWQNMRYKCPNLSRLASKYLCVPAIVTWYDGGRTWKEYSSFFQKRSILKSNTIDPLLFLHNNKFSF